MFGQSGCLPHVVDTNLHSYLMTNNANPDQLDSDLDQNCLQRQGISRFSRARVKSACSQAYISVGVHICVFVEYPKR